MNRKNPHEHLLIAFLRCLLASHASPCPHLGVRLTQVNAFEVAGVQPVQPMMPVQPLRFSSFFFSVGILISGNQ